MNFIEAYKTTAIIPHITMIFGISTLMIFPLIVLFRVNFKNVLLVERQIFMVSNFNYNNFTVNDSIVKNVSNNYNISEVH